MNENDAYIFDVEQPREWTFTGAPVWISGWFLSKVGGVFSDVRAVIDGIPHLGILGLPRSEIEQRHRGHVGLPHAGFLLRVNPPLDARELQIELLDAGHRWVEIWRTSIVVHQGAAGPNAYNLSLLPDHLHRLLQLRRQEPAAELAPLAGTLLLEGAAVPLDTLPNPPFFGALEKPELVGGTQYGKIRVEGWIIHREQRILRLTGSTHPQVENEFAYGMFPRVEAAELFPDHPHAALSQYFGLLDIDETAPGPAVIKMFAELEDGSKHLVFTRRFHPRSCNVWEKLLPAYQRANFLACLLALRSAARRNRVSLGSLPAQWRAARAAVTLCRRDSPETTPCELTQRDPYAGWQKANHLSLRLHSILASASHRLAEGGPRFALLIDTHACTLVQVTDLHTSLAEQIYPHWEAHFVGPVAPTGTDVRCRHHRCESPEELVRTLNAATAGSNAGWLTLLPGHARLSPDALLEIAERVDASPTLDLIYTDEDRMDDAWLPSEPDFKPDWSPAFALSGLFPGHLCLVRRARFEELGSFRDGFAAVAWFDLLLRLGDRLPAANVAHVARVCYHGRVGVPRELDHSHPAYEQARTALAETMARRRWQAAPFLPALGHQLRRCFHQLRWSHDLLARLPVTIVIPTRDRLHLLQECVELLEETVDWRHVKLVIVDDHSRDTDALRYLERIQARSDLQCTVVRLTDPHAPFNYSRLVNAALPHIETPLVLHLNNDVNAIETGWLEEMVGWFTEADVGIVGAKLVYADRTLNHTGIVIGPHGGLADTPWTRQAEHAVPPNWHAAAREVSAVTGACLLTRTELYRELAGFDEKDFGVAYNDVDYCLRVRGRGWRVIYTPQARLMHWGSATRGVTFDEAEHIAWLRRYPSYRDPFFSRHWRLEGTQVVCRATSGARPDRAGHLRVLLITHNLNLEGAPLFLLEYATHLAQSGAFSLEVITAKEGPLRHSFEALGAHLTLVDPAPLFRAREDSEFERQLDVLSGAVDWARTDLVVCNTLLCFWGVLLARRAGKSSLFYIHESTSVFRCFEDKLALPLHRHVHQALGGATRTLFLCAATRAYYADDDRGNFRIVPSWIHLETIEAFRAAHSKPAMRRKHGFTDDEIVIANIGTVCERKGQHIFIRAVARFRRQLQPGATPVRFVLVGAREGIYLDLLRRDMARLGVSDILLVPETRDVFDYFVAADLFVCSSFEESFPRVVMEAMAFRTPVVSTDVHGITELIGQRQDGYLVAPGDAEGMARMMQVCLAKERSGKSLAPTAYSKILRRHDAATVLPWHADLAREAWLEGE